MKTKLPTQSKKQYNPMEDLEIFGNRLKVPEAIQSDLDKEGLVGRFISIKKFNENGGMHEKGWVPYRLKNPVKNLLTGNTDETLKVGDLVLAVKSKVDVEKHQRFLKARADVQLGAHKKTVEEIRDRIREEKADKHVKLLEGYDEND